MEGLHFHWVIVANSWPGVQTCVCLRSALFRWWAIISGAGVYCACAYVCDFCHPEEGRNDTLNFDAGGRTAFRGRRCESVDLLRDGSTS